MNLSNRTLPVVVLFLALSGCAAYRGVPERYPSINTEIQNLKSYNEDAKIKEYNETNSQHRKKILRDEIINVRIRAIDLYFDLFRQAIFGESTKLNIGTDVTLLVLGGAGALISVTSIQSILAAITAGVAGVKVSIDKNLFFEKTAPALFARMVASRKEELVKIRAGLMQDVDQYPLMQALIDVNEYFNAGTIQGAVISITETSGAAGNEAGRELRNIMRTIPRREKPSSLRKEEKTNSLTQKDSMGKMKNRDPKFPVKSRKSKQSNITQQKTKQPEIITRDMGVNKVRSRLWNADRTILGPAK